MSSWKTKHSLALFKMILQTPLFPKIMQHTVFFQICNAVSDFVDPTACLKHTYHYKKHLSVNAKWYYMVEFFYTTLTGELERRIPPRFNRYMNPQWPHWNMNVSSWKHHTQREGNVQGQVYKTHVVWPWAAVCEITKGTFGQQAEEHTHKLTKKGFNYRL